MAPMTEDTRSPQRTALAAFWRAAGGDERLLAHVKFGGDGILPSAFAVSDLAAASIAAAGLAVAEYSAAVLGRVPDVTLDRRLSAMWFGTSLTPQGWTLPPAWDPIAGDYEAKDGWIRLHTNAPHHHDAALAVLGILPEREAVTAAVGRWEADALEAAIVERGGCAASMRDLAGWRLHQQGQAVAREPLLWFEAQGLAGEVRPPASLERPLAGLAGWLVAGSRPSRWWKLEGGQVRRRSGRLC